jgi:hypothetical protein
MLEKNSTGKNASVNNCLDLFFILIDEGKNKSLAFVSLNEHRP